MEVVTWGAIAGLCTVGGLVLKLWIDVYREIGVVKGTAAAAEQRAAAVEQDVIEQKKALVAVHNDVTMQNASFALYREQSAERNGEFITREMLGELERRLVADGRERFDLLTTQLSKLTERIDRLLARPDQPEPRRSR